MCLCKCLCKCWHYFRRCCGYSSIRRAGPACRELGASCLTGHRRHGRTCTSTYCTGTTSKQAHGKLQNKVGGEHHWQKRGRAKQSRMASGRLPAASRTWGEKKLEKAGHQEGMRLHQLSKLGKLKAEMQHEGRHRGRCQNQRRREGEGGRSRPRLDPDGGQSGPAGKSHCWSRAEAQQLLAKIAAHLRGSVR